MTVSQHIKVEKRKQWWYNNGLFAVAGSAIIILLSIIGSLLIDKFTKVELNQSDIERLMKDQLSYYKELTDDYKELAFKYSLICYKLKNDSIDLVRQDQWNKFQDNDLRAAGHLGNRGVISTEIKAINEAKRIGYNLGGSQ